LKLEFFNYLDAVASNLVIRPRGIATSLAKKDAAIWLTRRVKVRAKLYSITVGWCQWIDSSDDDPNKPEFNKDVNDPGSFDDSGDDEGHPGQNHNQHHHCGSRSSSHQEDAAAPAVHPEAESI
jgi:hypothetical protein